METDKKILLIGNAPNDGSVDYRNIISKYKHIVRFNMAPTKENYKKFPHLGDSCTHYFNNCWCGVSIFKQLPVGTKLFFTLPIKGPWLNARYDWAQVATKHGHKEEDCYQLTEADVIVMRA